MIFLDYLNPFGENYLHTSGGGCRKRKADNMIGVLRAGEGSEQFIQHFY